MERVATSFSHTPPISHQTRN